MPAAGRGGPAGVRPDRSSGATSIPSPTRSTSGRGNCRRRTADSRYTPHATAPLGRGGSSTCNSGHRRAPSTRADSQSDRSSTGRVPTYGSQWSAVLHRTTSPSGAARTSHPSGGSAARPGTPQPMRPHRGDTAPCLSRRSERCGPSLTPTAPGRSRLARWVLRRRMSEPSGPDRWPPEQIRAMALSDRAGVQDEVAVGRHGTQQRVEFLDGGQGGPALVPRIRVARTWRPAAPPPRRARGRCAPVAAGGADRSRDACPAHSPRNGRRPRGALAP